MPKRRCFEPFLPKNIAPKPLIRAVLTLLKFSLLRKNKNSFPLFSILFYRYFSQNQFTEIIRD
jgi:hypothetical protein